MGDEKKILFIGNSYTHCNNLPRMLELLVADAAGRPALTTKYFAPGGWTFEQHWNDPRPMALLNEGGWDYVVLQEQTRRPYEENEPFRAYATRWREAIQKIGAKTVLYMTWRTEWEPQNQALLNKVYGELGRDLKAQVIPSGVAFELLHRDRKGIDPFVEDRRHPSAAGTYLSACTFYAWLRNESPVGRTAKALESGNAIPGCNAEQIRYVQELAWQAWCDWRDGKIAF